MPNIKPEQKIVHQQSKFRQKVRDRLPAQSGAFIFIHMPGEQFANNYLQHYGANTWAEMNKERM